MGFRLELQRLGAEKVSVMERTNGRKAGKCGGMVWRLIFVSVSGKGNPMNWDVKDFPNELLTMV